ncbi:MULTISPECIES: molybdenum cofactor guanylyltransferase [Sphingomonas]|jgi:molybdopterin-guanine dinucleotide biosynthesis protein A|uniref:molybdenum cofactor guanylyltransferase n=1 Tax=Sphingomonas TaxID=13687 RepID=UPI000832F190|nr:MULTISPECIES: molybdenum cofactor guanylyltransferase [Sphingomonas]MBY0302509.1 molybdenum cofactor guanylyltransferase [Sphingomonas ginsenosidimutans]
MIRILGAVLAGGRSSRFGSDKALATWRDTALIDHALASLSPHVADLLVVGRTDARVRTAPDLPYPDLGPLGGIAGALEVAAREGFDAVLTTACDTPRLPPALVAALLGQDAAHAAEAPTVGLWPVRLAAPLLDRLSAGGDRSIRGWAREAGAVAVLPGAVLANVNTPDDLARLDGAVRG